jgi:hypothetical protein
MTQQWPKISLALMFSLILVAASDCGSSQAETLSQAASTSSSEANTQPEQSREALDSPDTPVAPENSENDLANTSSPPSTISESNNRVLNNLRLALILLWFSSVSAAIPWILLLQKEHSQKLAEIAENLDTLRSTDIPEGVLKLEGILRNLSLDKPGGSNQVNDSSLTEKQPSLDEEVDLPTEKLEEEIEPQNIKDIEAKQPSGESDPGIETDVSKSGGSLDSSVLPWVTEYNRLSLHGQKEQAAEFATKHNAQEVAQTETSLSQQWVGRKEGIYFEINTNTGSYWLIKSFNQQPPVYHIVPNKRKFSFTESALPTIQAYFELKQAGADGSQGFDPNKVADMNKFQVIYPAEVIEVSAGQQWELKKKGLLEFSSQARETYVEKVRA